MAFFHSPRIVTDGLVLALDAGNPKSYPGEGSTWYDKSGNGYNGTLTNGPTFSNGSIVFDGVDDFVISSPNILSSITSNLTLECIFQRNSGRTIINYGPASNGAYKYFNFEAPGSTLRTVLATFNNNVVLDGTTTINTNTWYYGAVTYDGSIVKIYVNGNLENTTSATGNIRYASDPSLNIGRKNAGNGEYINGKVSSAKIYNRALTASEILQNYNAIKGRFGL